MIAMSSPQAQRRSLALENIRRTNGVGILGIVPLSFFKFADFLKLKLAGLFASGQVNAVLVTVFMGAFG